MKIKITTKDYLGNEGVSTFIGAKGYRKANGILTVFIDGVNTATFNVSDVVRFDIVEDENEE